MSDDSSGDFWRDIKEHRRDKRLQRHYDSLEFLRVNDISFVAKNHGSHLVIEGAGITVDFWPSSAKWSVRGSGRTRCGVESLVKLLKPKKAKP